MSKPFQVLPGGNDGTLYGPVTAQLDTASFMSRVYLWMTAGICLSGAIAWWIGNDPQIASALFARPGLMFVLMGLQLVAVFTMSFAIRRINSFAAAALYLGYAALTGVTLSTIFLIYTRQSIESVFGLTAFSFAGLSAFGYVTKKDLGPVGSFCVMGLWGLIGYGLLSLFFPGMMASTAGRVYSLCGVVVFAGLTAYDTQKIKALSLIGAEGSDEDRKEAIYGALTLYLDFVNLFLQLLRLMGRRRE